MSTDEEILQTYRVPAGVKRARADKILSGAYPEQSRTAFARSFDAGLVTVAGKPAGRDVHVSEGDTLTFRFARPVPSDLTPAKIRLDVIFEDKYLLALNKPAGMTVHPGAGTGGDTLVHALLSHCKGSLSGIGGVERPGIVHRLDRETSGLIIVAKSDAAHRGLAEQFSERTVQKEYLALASGEPQLLSGSIRRPIGRNPRHRHKMAVIEGEQAGHGRDARTDWEVIERFGGIASLLRCRIHTGRTHQIRVHLRSLGHPILGDRIYGWKPDPRQKALPKRVMLHAEHLVIRHPITGKVLDLRAKLPADFEKMLGALRTDGLPRKGTKRRKQL